MIAPVEVRMGSDQWDRRIVGSSLTQPPYLGALGKTRTEPAQVWMPDGKIRSLSVYTGVDAVADPALAGIACAGTLHQLGHGVSLAIPFTYHDAQAALFLIVIPEGLRHRALALRAEHMALIAADVEHAVPEYVRECEIVIGAEGLSARIESGTSGPSVSRGEMADAEARLSLLRERERALERRERLMSARETVVVSQPNSLPARPVLDSEISVIEDDEPLAFGETVLAETLYTNETEDSELLDDDGELEDVEEVEAEAIDSDDEDVNQLHEIPPRSLHLQTFAEPWPFEERTSLMDALSPVAVSDGSTPLPPDAFARDRTAQLCALESEGKVWLFVRGRPESPHDCDDLDLLVQLDPNAQVPIVLLTLVFDLSGAPEVLRCAVDPEDSEQSRALIALSERFAVQLVALGDDGELEHWATLRGPRERNVQAVLSAIEGKMFSRQAWLAAREATLREPPDYRDLEHPFQIAPAEIHAASATEAAVALDELVEYLEPARRERLTLLFSVPQDVIDAHYKVGIGDALDWGLSLPASLASVATELGIAPDEATLLSRRIAGLCRTSREPDLGGLESGVLRALWTEVVDRAAVLDVSLSAEAEALLATHVGERARAHAEALAETNDADLLPLRAALHLSPVDMSKLSELAQRGSHRDLVDLGELTTQLNDEQTAHLFVRMITRGDSTAKEALHSLLVHSAVERVRLAAASSLASLRSVDAIDHLVARMLATPPPDRSLYARCLGRYGVGSFRAIQRALEQADADDEAVAYVHAHLAQHGALAQVRARSRSHDMREASVARRAMQLAGELKDATSYAQGLEKQGPLTVFCELFDRSLRAQSA